MKLGELKDQQDLLPKGYKNQGYEVEVLTSCNEDYYAFR